MRGEAKKILYLNKSTGQEKKFQLPSLKKLSRKNYLEITGFLYTQRKNAESAHSPRF